MYGRIVRLIVNLVLNVKLGTCRDRLTTNTNTQLVGCINAQLGSVQVAGLCMTRLCKFMQAVIERRSALAQSFSGNVSLASSGLSATQYDPLGVLSTPVSSCRAFSTLGSTHPKLSVLLGL
jgi:hypothetical protein